MNAQVRINICRSFLKAMRFVHRTKGVPIDTGAAVLGDQYGYTIEMPNGDQHYVGRVHCKYCARVEGLHIIAAKHEESNH